MKKFIMAFATAALAFGLAAAPTPTSLYTEVYVSIPGTPAVHCPVATVTFLDHGIVKVETTWGVTYTTHLANVVIVTRKNGVQNK